MNHKEQIIKMVNEMENEKYIEKIYNFVLYPYNKEKQEKKKEDK